MVYFNDRFLTKSSILVIKSCNISTQSLDRSSKVRLKLRSVRFFSFRLHIILNQHNYFTCGKGVVYISG